MGNQKSSIEEAELTDEQKLIRRQISANPFIQVDNYSFSAVIPLVSVTILLFQTTFYFVIFQSFRIIILNFTYS